MTIATEHSLEQKLAHLEDILRPMGQALVGYSGGVDSAMLAVAVQRVLGDGAICVTADSESYASGELDKATEITRAFGIRHEVVKTRELDNPDYAKNAPNRCYYCKQELFVLMGQLARDMQIDYILYGQNADDVGDFRPGATAAKEHGVRAPLAEAGLTKADVRALAQRWGLSVWDRPAMACLSSRFPYGTAVTAEGLKRVDQAEHFLRAECHFAQVRCRHHEKIARIELPAEDLEHLLADADLRQQLVRYFSAIGYLQITADLRGFRSGSMNEALLAIEAEDAPLFERVDPILAAHGFFAAAYEQREKMLLLRLPAHAINQLLAPELRDQLVAELASLGLHYIALDMDPLRI